jgi:hypothetical protein
MKSIWIATAAVAATTLALTGCKYRKEEPVPPPKATAWAAPSAPSAPIRVKTANAPARHEAGANGAHHGASGISWFQGTIEEAFSTSCATCPALEHGVVKPMKPMSTLRH